MSASVTFLPAASRRAPLVRRARAWLRAAMIARHTRRMLAEMDDRLLADIGASRADALYEASRPMWELSLRR